MDSFGIAPIEQVVGAIWLIWLVSWMIAAGWSARCARPGQPAGVHRNALGSLGAALMTRRVPMLFSEASGAGLVRAFLVGVPELGVAALALLVQPA